MRERRVLLVSPGWPRSSFANGIVSYVAALKGGLETLGCSVRVAAFATSPTAPAAPTAETMTSIRGSFKRRGPVGRIAAGATRRLAPGFHAQALGVLDAVCALRAVYSEWPFDLIEVEESRGLSAWIARALPVPVVVRLHGPWFLNGPARGVPDDDAFRSRVAREGRAIARAEALSSPSQDVLERVRQRYGLALPHARVIPNPGPEPDEESLWSPAGAEPGLIVFVGRFDRHKGGDLVVDAFARLAAAGRPVRLVIAGRDAGCVDAAGRSWSLPEYIADRVPAEHRPAIEFLGEVPPTRLVALRQRASAVVVASRYEVFGLTVIEALAQGAPLVCSDAGAFTEILEHGRNALIFPSGNAEALADRLQVLLDDPQRAAALAAQGHADYRARYLPEPVARATLEFYEEVLARTRRRRRVAER